MTAHKTYVCRLTPEGRGAIATVLVWGPSAVACVAAQFHARSRLPLTETPIGRILFGTWSPAKEPPETASPAMESPAMESPSGGESRSAAEVGEEVVVCRTDAERVEVHCHGGQAAAHALVDSLKLQGCRVVDWPDLPSTDRIQRDVRVALASARTETVAAILIDQQRGALATALDQLDRALAENDSAASHDLLAELLRHRRFGCRLTTAWRVAIVGPPNVGKSSLINAIVGFQRAIVFDSPGTTRDVVTASTAIDGWLVDFADTAGIRVTDDTIEAAGVERTVEQLKRSDLVIVVLDAREPVTPEIQKVLRDLPEALMVQNKIDLVSSRQQLSRPSLPTSATRGDGISELLASVSQRLVGQPPPPGTAVPFTVEQFDELLAIQAAIDESDLQLAQNRLVQFRSV